MISSCSSGVFTPERTGIIRYTDRSIGYNHVLKNSFEGRKQNNSTKSSHLGKSAQSDETGTSTRRDESCTSRPQYNMRIPIIQPPVERGLCTRGTSMDPRYAFQPTPFNMFNATDSDIALSETASGPKSVMENTSSYDATMTTYDPTMHQAFVSQLQSYVSGVPCAIPECSICNPLITSPAYMTAQFASRSTTQSSLLTPSIAASHMDPAIGGSASCGPCYMWIGQAVAAQKQLMQTQFALSHLSLGLPTTMVPPSDCSMNILALQPSTKTVQDTFLRDSVTNTGNIASSAQQAPTSAIIKEPVTSACSFIDPSAQNRVDSNSPGSTDSSRPSQLEHDGSVVQRPVTVPPDALVNSNIGWTTTNYLGSNTLWLPPTYAQQYFQLLPLPIGSVPPTPVVGFSDPIMLPSVVGRPFSSGDRSNGSMQNYYTSATNFSSIPPYANTVKLPVPKTYNFGQGVTHSTLYLTPPIVAAASQPLSSTHWQLLWNALAASKQSAALLQAHPLVPSGVPLDRSGLTRRRANTGTTNRNPAYKGFDLAELATLRLSVNPIEFDVSILFRARFFMIKSDCEYNIHQAIRHGVWCSTRAGNQCLDEAYHSVQSNFFTTIDDHSGSQSLTFQSMPTSGSSKEHRAGHVLLIFSTRSSGYLNGVAEMIGPVNPQKRCSIWQDSRFRGEIPVRWIYVKNVPNSLVKHILIESYDNRPVTVLRDTSEILPASKGEELLRIIHNHNNPQKRTSQYNW